MYFDTSFFITCRLHKHMLYLYLIHNFLFSFCFLILCIFLNIYMLMHLNVLIFISCGNRFQIKMGAAIEDEKYFYICFARNLCEKCTDFGCRHHLFHSILFILPSFERACVKQNYPFFNVVYESKNCLFRLRFDEFQNGK